MSSTGRGRTKVPNDAYMTPAEPIKSLKRAMDLSMVGAYGMLEPCRGTGNILNAFDAGWKKYAEIGEGIDYRTTPFTDVDYTITNPPFTYALEFLQKSLEETQTVIYLLRLNFLGSQARKAFWQANRPTHVLTLSKRPVFVWICKGQSIDGQRVKGCGSTYQPDQCTECEVCGGNVRPATDSIEYAWFAWDRLGMIELPAGVHVL